MIMIDTVSAQNLLAPFSCVRGKRYFMALSPAWWSWQAVLNFSHISIKLKKNNKNFYQRATPSNLRKQVKGVACPAYSDSSLSCESRE